MLVITSLNLLEFNHYFKIELNGFSERLSKFNPNSLKEYNSVI